MISEDISARNIFDAILPLVSEHARFNNNRTNYEGIIETPTTKQSISDTTPTDLQVNLKGDTGTCMQSAIYTRRNVSHPLVKLEIPPTNHIKISTPSVAALSHSVFLSENDLPEKNLSIVSSIETSDTKEAYYTRGTRYGRSSCSEIVPDKPNPADDGNENYVIGHQTGLSIKFFRGARKQRTCQRQRNLDFRFDGPKPSNLGTKEAICLENLLSDWSNSTLFEPLDSVRSNFAQSKCEFLRYPVALAAAMARAQDNSYLTNYYRSGGSSPCSINSERWNNPSKLRLPDQGFLEIDDTHFSFPPSEPDSLASDSHTSLQESQESTSRPRTKAQFNEMCSSAKVYRRKPTYFLDSHSPFLKHKGKPKRTAKVTKRRPYKKNRLLCSFNKRKGRAKKAVITQPCLTLSLRPNKNNHLLPRADPAIPSPSSCYSRLSPEKPVPLLNVNKLYGSSAIKEVAYTNVFTSTNSPCSSTSTSSASLTLPTTNSFSTVNKPLCDVKTSNGKPVPSKQSSKMHNYGFSRPPRTAMAVKQPCKKIDSFAARLISVDALVPKPSPSPKLHQVFLEQNGGLHPFMLLGDAIRLICLIHFSRGNCHTQMVNDLVVLCQQRSNLVRTPYLRIKSHSGLVSVLQGFPYACDSIKNDQLAWLLEARFLRAFIIPITEEKNLMSDAANTASRVFTEISLNREVSWNVCCPPQILLQVACIIFRKNAFQCLVDMKSKTEANTIPFSEPSSQQIGPVDPINNERNPSKDSDNSRKPCFSVAHFDCVLSSLLPIFYSFCANTITLDAEKRAGFGFLCDLIETIYRILYVGDTSNPAEPSKTRNLINELENVHKHFEHAFRRIRDIYASFVSAGACLAARYRLSVSADPESANHKLDKGRARLFPSLDAAQANVLRILKLELYPDLLSIVTSVNQLKAWIDECLNEEQILRQTKTFISNKDDEGLVTDNFRLIESILETEIQAYADFPRFRAISICLSGAYDLVKCKIVPLFSRISEDITNVSNTLTLIRCRLTTSWYSAYKTLEEDCLRNSDEDIKSLINAFQHSYDNFEAWLRYVHNKATKEFSILQDLRCQIGLSSDSIRIEALRVPYGSKNSVESTDYTLVPDFPLWPPQHHMKNTSTMDHVETRYCRPTASFENSSRQPRSMSRSDSPDSAHELEQITKQPKDPNSQLASERVALPLSSCNGKTACRLYCGMSYLTEDGSGNVLIQNAEMKSNFSKNNINGVNPTHRFYSPDTGQDDFPIRCMDNNAANLDEMHAKEIRSDLSPTDGFSDVLAGYQIYTSGKGQPNAISGELYPRDRKDGVAIKQNPGKILNKQDHSESDVERRDRGGSQKSVVIISHNEGQDIDKIFRREDYLNLPMGSCVKEPQQDKQKVTDLTDLPKIGAIILSDKDPHRIIQAEMTEVAGDGEIRPCQAKRKALDTGKLRAPISKPSILPTQAHKKRRRSSFVDHIDLTNSGSDEELSPVKQEISRKIVISEEAALLDLYIT